MCAIRFLEPTLITATIEFEPTELIFIGRCSDTTKASAPVEVTREKKKINNKEIKQEKKHEYVFCVEPIKLSCATVKIYFISCS